jgi:hypothetical protein
MIKSTSSAAEASAHVLAVMVAANGHLDDNELAVLDELDAFRRLGVNRQRFVELANVCLSDIGAGLCERSWLSPEDLSYVDRLLDAVASTEQRLLVCRLAAAVITADGRVTHDERLVYTHALTHWRISDERVTQEILHDRAH